MKSIQLIIICIVGLSSIKSFSQDSVRQHINKIVYTCSMHPEVKKDKAGKCPKCGMDLVQTKNGSVPKKIYSCSMHPEITSDKPGKCSKCGMELTEQKVKTKTKTS